MKDFETEIQTKNILWKNIMNSWLSINIEYINDWYDDYKNYQDCAYWYNERTCVGILSGAIWKNNGICLEEFSSIKDSWDDEIKKVKDIKRNGRTDLYFYVNNEQYIVEAKFIKKDKINSSNIESTLNSATKDTIESLKHEKNVNPELKGMALVFVVPTGENNFIEKNSLDFEYDMFCSLESKLKSNIQCDDLIANSCYIIGKEVEK